MERTDFDQCFETRDFKISELKETDSYQGVLLKTPFESEIVANDSLILCEDCLLTSSMKTLANALVKELTREGKTMSVAESLTGGELASSIVNVSGASKVFDQGIVSYSNNAKKTLLGVKEESLNDFGAVSKQVALEMARGVLKDNDYALSTTGIAGPKGDGICEKIGTVFIGLATKTEVQAFGFHFDGSRDEVREKSVQTALSLLLTKIVKDKIGKN